jgi:hypothetical protein
MGKSIVEECRSIDTKELVENGFSKRKVATVG